MSSQQNLKNIIHPKIIAIQTHITNANDFWRTQHYMGFLIELDLTIAELFPSDQPEAIQDKVYKEIRTIENFQYPGRRTKRMVNMKWSYREWFYNLQKHISTCGYFENKKYGAGDFGLFKGDEEFTDV
jgi:hypothetical protein